MDDAFVNLAAQLSELEFGPVTSDWEGRPLPRRGVLATGEAHATIGDRDDYRRLRRQTVGARPGP